MGFDGEHFPGEGVGQVDFFGAEPLVGVAELERIFLAFDGAVLGVAQDGTAHMGAVEPELVGPARQGFQLHEGPAIHAVKDPASGPGGLAGVADVTEQTGQGTAVDGGVDDAFVHGKCAEAQGLVGLLQGGLL